MKKVLPAILAESMDEFEKKLSALSAFSNEIQIDITDGTFVDSKTIELIEIKELPGSIKFELHMMVADPLEYLPVIKRLGVKRIAFHNEIDLNTAEVIDKLKGEGFEVVLAINPDSAVSTLDEYVGKVDGVLLMSVNPGYSGQELIPSVIEKAKILRAQNPNLLIEMDGGIKKDNIEEVFSAGVNVAVIGSGILKAENPAEEWNILQEIKNKL